MATNVSSAQIDGTYWPSFKVRLIVRFEEFGSTELQRTAPPKPTTVLKGTKDQRAPLVATPDTSVPGTRRFTLAPAGQQPPPGGPQGQVSSVDNLTHVIAGIIPKRVTWNQNGIRAADTATVKIKTIDCPLDPRTIRSMGVEVYGGTVKAADYAAGVAGQTRTGSTGQVNYREPLNVIPDSYQDDQGVTRSNLRFQGFVDDLADDWDDDGEPTLTLECCDNTRLLIDVEAPAGLVISPKKPIDEAIADYLSNFPNFSGLAVQYLPASTTPPQLGAALAGTAFQPQLGPPPSKGGAAAEKLSVWDYLTDVTGAIGHIIRVDATTILIQQVQTLLSNQTARRVDDPFQGRTVDGVSFQYRRLIWGRNLGKMKIARKYAKSTPTNVECRCYSTRRKKTLVARFPDPKGAANKLVSTFRPGDATTDQKWTVFRIRGIEDEATLKMIAQNVYQSVGRNEITLDLKTKNLASFGAGNLDPDILDMRVGDTFELLVARETHFGTSGELEDRLLASASQLMQDLGFDDQLAAAYAKAYVDGGFQTTFRLRQMSVDWDGDEEGVSIDLHGANYVEIRVDQPFKGSP